MSVSPAYSQQQDDSTVIYDSAYFSQFNAVSLEDMIRSIPGGVSALGGGQNNNRGLGSSSDTPILINGRRMAGKSNDMSTMLARILAEQVDRIELIRGNAEGLDIRNEGIIYNVILRESSENTSSNFIRAGLQGVSGTSVLPEILLSHSGQRDKLEYVLSYEYDTQPRVKTIYEDVLTQQGTPVQYRALLREERTTAHILTGSLAYEFSNNTTVQINGLYSEEDAKQDGQEDQFLLNTSGNSRTLFAFENALIDETDDLLELGGDIEFDVGELGRLKTVFVYNRSESDESINQELLSNGIVTPLFTSYSQYDAGETILRSSMSSTIGKHTWDYGAEAAYNTLDATYTFNDSGVQNAIVEEDRYEVFLTHSTDLTNKVSLQSALTAEYSTISQNREGETKSRSFDFLKPRVELRYDKTTSDQFRLLVERTVSQLDLGGFVASRDIVDDRINFGNPNLQPESTWTTSLGYERRFDNDGGSLDVTIYYSKISNHIDKILIGNYSDAASGTGNIGDADQIGLEAVFNKRLDFIGLPAAVLTFTYRKTETETTDPFTGESRDIVNISPHHFNIDFRYDAENSKLAWGWDAHRNYGVRSRQDVSLRETNEFTTHVSIFSEYNFTPTMKARFEANHITGDTRSFNKVIYNGHIVNDSINRIEVQEDIYKPDYLLSLQASF